MVNFTKIFVVGHGDNSGVNTLFAIGHNAFTETQIKAMNSKIDLFNGCYSNASPGQIITTGSVISAWSMPTINYLYE